MKSGHQRDIQALHPSRWDVHLIEVKYCNLNILFACIIKPLRTIGITGFHKLIATNEQFLLSGNQLK